MLHKKKSAFIFKRTFLLYAGFSASCQWQAIKSCYPGVSSSVKIRKIRTQYPFTNEKKNNTLIKKACTGTAKPKSES